MLNDRLGCSAPSSQGEIDQINAIRNEISRHIELFSPPAARSETERHGVRHLCQIQPTGVTMDIYSGLATHAAVLLARWMAINHLIYELNGHSVACFLTCNNVTTAKQLRKMRENCSGAWHCSCTALDWTSDVLSGSLCMDELLPANFFMYLMQRGEGLEREVR